MIAQVAPVVLAFGANLGDRAEIIRAAQRELASHPNIFDFAASPLIESVAEKLEGPDEDAPRYLNGVARAVTTLTPDELLDLVHEIEAKHGRVRDERWGDRTLDIDIIVFAGRVQREPHLTLPHPRAHERDFVLAPWLLLDPDAVLLRHGRVRELLERVGDHTRAYEGADPGLGEQ